MTDTNQPNQQPPLDRLERRLLYLGVPSGALFAVAGLGARVPDTAGDSGALELVHDHAVRNLVASFASGLCCVTLLAFVTAVHRVLRADRTEGRPVDTVANLSFVGGLLVAAAMATQALLIKAAVDAADRGDSAGLDTISYLGTNWWLLWVPPAAVFYLATGLCALRTRALPRWLAVATIALGAMSALGPAGLITYMLTPAWLPLAGILLVRRPPRSSSIGSRPRPTSTASPVSP